MTSPKPVSPQDPQAVALHWHESTDLVQTLADEAIIQVVQDRVYLTVGQVQMPATTAIRGVNSLEVAPVARLVYTFDAFEKLVKTLNNISNQMKINSKNDE